MVNSGRDTIFLPENVVKMLGVSVVEARSAAEPRLLEMQGSLALDTNKLVRVHARFAGEVIEIAAVADRRRGTAQAAAGQPGRRPMSFGERSRRISSMAVVWSKDLGEKKSELIDSLSQLRVGPANARPLVKAYAQGAIPERTMHDMERNVEADQIAVSRAERTLEAWRLPEGEIQAVREEAQAVHERHGKRTSLKEKDWARVEVRAPFDGVVVEKNLAVGDIIDTTSDLFKVASLSIDDRLGQRPRGETSRAVGPAAGAADLERADQRGAGHAAAGRPDGPHRLYQRPTQHTVMVMGHIDNPRERYRAGQFITATVQLPPASRRWWCRPPRWSKTARRAVVRPDRPPAVGTTACVRGRASPHAEGSAPPLRSRAGGGRTGLAAVRPGERVVAGSAIQLRAALDDLLAAAKTRKPSMARDIALATVRRLVAAPRNSASQSSCARDLNG